MSSKEQLKLPLLQVKPASQALARCHHHKDVTKPTKVPQKDTSLDPIHQATNQTSSRRNLTIRTGSGAWKLDTHKPATRACHPSTKPEKLRKETSTGKAPTANYHISCPSQVHQVQRPQKITATKATKSQQAAKTASLRVPGSRTSQAPRRGMPRAKKSANKPRLSICSTSFNPSPLSSPLGEPDAQSTPNTKAAIMLRFPDVQFVPTKLC